MLETFVAVESFLNPVWATEVWPESIVKNPVFQEQIGQRQELVGRLDDVVNRLPRPDISLKNAVGYGFITEDQVTKLYTSLSELWEMDADHQRLVFYLPFEFLPDAEWQPKGLLREAVRLFKQAYMKSWKNLLSIYDVRANFVDGDVLEVEQRIGDLPRVAKAAHLIPKLIEKGLLKAADVLTILAESEDEIIKDSIADTLPVLADLGFIDEKEIISRKIQVRTEPAIITEKRQAWLDWREHQKKVELLAQKIGQRIKREAMTDEDFIKLMKNDDPNTREAVWRALRRFFNSWDTGNERSLFSLPSLAGPFSRNLKLIEEMRVIERITISLKKNSELSELIYPLVVVYGSRLNGYGEETADIDLAVFVKPEISFEERPRLKNLLKRTFVHPKVKSQEIIEFWLKEDNGQLRVRDFKEADVTLGESYWAHILFGAAWLGEKEDIRYLAEKMLIPYFCQEEEPRRLCLESLEQSTLQYRLMHKGYESFFAPCGGIKTKRSGSIDGDSVFWDSGYRQLATRLFLSRVFLPKIIT
jgi:predicted nucleotidyltransferase